MFLPKHFQRFEKEISLNPHRQNRIDKAVRSVTNFVARDAPLQRFLIHDPIPQGSFATNTAVRPAKGNIDYDVDLILPMDFDEFPHDWLSAGNRHPDYIIRYVRDRLKTNYFVRIERRSRCVRLNYADDFHIDLIPAHAPDGVGGHYQICDRSTGKFIPTDPQAYVAWVQELDAQYGGRFVPVVKMLKRWRDLKFGAKSGPSSMHLTVAAGRSLEAYDGKSTLAFDWLSDEHDHVEALLWDTINSMRGFIQPTFWRGRCELAMPGAVPEDIEESWDNADQDLTLRHLDTLIKRAEQAIWTNRQDVAVRRWQGCFGTSFITNVR